MSDALPPTQPPAAPSDAAPQRPVVIFEDLTLAEALRYFWWRPGQTARLLWQVLVRDPDEEAPARDHASNGPAAPVAHAVPVPVLASEDEREPVEARAVEEAAPARESRAWAVRLIVLGVALLLAVWGGTVLHAAAASLSLRAAGDTNGATWRFVLAAALVVGFELAASRGWWARRYPGAVRRLRALGGEQTPAPVNAGLAAGIALLLWFAVVLPGAPLGSALLLALAAGLWLALVLRALPVEGSEADAGVPPAEVEATPAEVPQARFGFWPWFHARAYRLMLIPVALLFSTLAFLYNVERGPEGYISDVVLTPTGTAAWVLSVALWAAALALDARALVGRSRGAAARWRVRVPRPGWPLAALAAIVAVGAAIRLANLDAVPPEMTSDHIEKLLDALRAGQGHIAVFFPNNGGREGFQMALVGLIAELGAGYSFTALKLATVLEGVLTLPALWWMARQIIGDETPARRQLGQWVGLSLAALVAVSTWHVMLSRLGLRIVLTPLTTALMLGFLARAMRRNRLGDWILLGLTLGAGVYFYQANRMLPVVAVLGALLAVAGRVRARRDLLAVLRDGLLVAALALLPVAGYVGLIAALQGASGAGMQAAGDRLEAFLPLAVMLWFGVAVLILRAPPWADRAVPAYASGLLAAAVIALAVFIPMYRYAELYPDYFWNRTRGRMFGDEAFVVQDPDTGALVSTDPSLREQAEYFWEHRDVFLDNYRDALRMYHWEGDGMWITNTDARPALDAVAGGLAILGAALWGVRLVRRRDPVDWLVPVTVLVMLLPSAMTLAYTNENPSFTRASGTLPAVYLLAAVPVGLLGYGITQAPGRGRRDAVVRVGLGLAVLAAVVGAALPSNWRAYFEDYRLNYSYSWRPYQAIAAPLRDFATGEGSYGNAFMVAYPHWLDHRILGAVAGDIRWPNGLVQRGDLVTRVMLSRGTAYEFDPTRPVFVMVHPDDAETITFLKGLLPGGEVETYRYTYETSHGELAGEFLIYRAPGSALKVGQ